MRYCGLQDELTFLNSGTPDTTSGLQRIPQTTWAYWLRRPNNAMPNVVELSIVVYSNRNLQTGSAETLLTGVNNSANPTINPSGNPTDADPCAGTDIRRGMWIVDVTTNYPAPGQTANARNLGPVQGNWYRVVSADDTGIGVQLELQPVPVVARQNIIVMEDVAEVFPRGTGWKYGVCLAASSRAARNARQVVFTGGSPMRRRSGFTITELLVAMALIVFVMSILATAFSEGMKTFRAFKGIGDMNQRLRTASSLLRDDLQNPHFEGDRRLSDANFWTIGPPREEFGPPREGFFRSAVRDQSQSPAQLAVLQ